MSVDLSLIIPNNCRSITDKSEARKCFDDLINYIKKYFHGKNFITDIDIVEDDEDPDAIYFEYSFEIPLLDISVYLNSGYWIVNYGFRYSYYFEPLGIDILGNPTIWLRDLCYNVLLLFGRNDAYICDEHHGYDCELYGLPNITIDDWINYGVSESDSIVYNFSFNELLQNRSNYFDPYNNYPNYNYKSKFYDDFKECHQVFDVLKKRFPEYEILVYKTPLENYLLVAKDDNLYFINSITGESLTDFPIDFCKANFNGAGLQIFRGEKSAFFNFKGVQLTDFRIGDFSWKWGCSDEDYLRGHQGKYRRIIIDHAMNRLFLSDGTAVTCMRWSDEHKDLVKNKYFRRQR